MPLNVTITRDDNRTVNGATVTNIPGGNSRGTQRPDLVPGVDPYLKNGVRWLNPAAFATPQPGTFGNLPRNFLRGPELLAARPDVQQGLPLHEHAGHPAARRDVQHRQPAELREPGGQPADNGTPGVPFTDAQAGTFGYMLGPLNRTVGLGTARQTQISLRYTF